MATLTADRRGWGSPGTPGSTTGARYRRDNIIKVSAGGIHIYCHRLIAPLVEGFLNEIVARGYPLNVRSDDWGYNHRFIRGYESSGNLGYLSNHSWGLAVDLNAISNPMTSDGRLITDMPPWVPHVAAKWGLSWGGNWTGKRKDAMHYEFLGTPEDVQKFAHGLVVLDHHDIKEKVEDDMRWLVRGPKGDVYVFDGIYLHPANDQQYRNILVWHGANVPKGKSWHQWTQRQINAVPKAPMAKAS